MYDGTLTENCIHNMYFAPFLCLSIGAWAFSNQQVFRNNAVPLNPNYVYPLCDHTILQFFTQLTPGTVLVFFRIFFFVSAVF